MNQRNQILDAQEASEILGVPAIQLERWAYLGQGPENIGTKYKPRYTEEGLEEWIEDLFFKKQALTPYVDLSPANPEN